MQIKKKPSDKSLEIMRELKIKKNMEDRLENKGIRKKKPRIGEGPAGAKRKTRARSAEKLYDSKRKSFRESKIDEFSVGGITKAAKTLINKYKPKIKNEKEDYGLYSKQDYSDVVKNYEKTQQRKKRNRAGTVIGGAATAVTVQSKKDKENKK